MSRQEVIELKLTEIIAPLLVRRVLRPEDEAELLETVRAASGFLADDEETAMAEATNALHYFVERVQVEFSEGSFAGADHEIFRAAQSEFLPCPPFCRLAVL